MAWCFGALTPTSDTVRTGHCHPWCKLHWNRFNYTRYVCIYSITALIIHLDGCELRKGTIHLFRIYYLAVEVIASQYTHFPMGTANIPIKIKSSKKPSVLHSDDGSQKRNKKCLVLLEHSFEHPQQIYNFSDKV